MMPNRLISQLLIFALMADALVVCIRLARKKTAWGLIVLYWAILTAKNLVDFVGMI